MATGDVNLFDEFSEDIGQNVHQLGTHTIKCGLITSAATPVVTEVTPDWGTYSANEVSGTNYSAGGATLTATAADWNHSAGVTSLRADATTWSQSGTGFSNARWGIIYNDTDASDTAIAFLDLGGNVGNVSGDLTITWGGTTPNGDIFRCTA